MKIPLRIGLHTSISGSLEQAAIRAGELGADTFQIFTTSPRQWRAVAPDPADVERFRCTRERLGLSPLVIHDNYLINLAAADPALRAKSIRALAGELRRAETLGAAYLVAHPGSARDSGSLERGVELVAGAIARAAADAAGTKKRKKKGVMLLLENTAGAGSQIGSRFEELAAIRDLAQPTCPGLEIGFCLDTCHALAAGYEMSTRAGVRATLRDADRILGGLDRVAVVHANDSKGALGSHIDRHEHIGQGHIGEEGFRALLTHPALRGKAFILETPRQNDTDEIRNLNNLRRLCRKSSTTTKPSN